MDAAARSTESWADQADSSAAGSNRATFITVGDQPLGLAAIYRDKNDPDVGELIQMWVGPQSRGGFVAAELLIEMFRWAEANGFSCVKAEVMKSNARALRFFEKFGFRVAVNESVQSPASLLLIKNVEPAPLI